MYVAWFIALFWLYLNPVEKLLKTTIFSYDLAPPSQRTEWEQKKNKNQNADKKTKTPSNIYKRWLIYSIG